LKAAAAAAKASGGTNRKAAEIIYKTKYPTPQEVKNVPSILRNYRAKVETSRAPSIPKALGRPINTRVEKYPFIRYRKVFFR